jgi:hypothetical protein
MMKNIFRASAITIAILANLPLAAQNAAGGTGSAPGRPPKFDFAVTYAPEFIKIANTSGPWQVIAGGSADGVYNLSSRFKHLGVAADLDYESNDAIQPGVNLRQFSMVAGPRYTVKNSFGAAFYVETLFGFVHASNTVLPTSTEFESSATSFAMQLGGGFGIPINQHFGWRVLAVDYVGTRLPNNGDNYQADLRISTGATFHF